MPDKNPRPDLGTIKVKYTNHKGVTAIRTITPLNLMFKSTPYHPEAQMLLNCWDIDKNAFRTFALKDCDFVSAQDGA